MAEEGRSLGSLVDGLQEEYGEHHYGRLDLHIPEEIKQSAHAPRGGRRARVCRHAGFAHGNAGRAESFISTIPRPAVANQPPPAETWLLLRASGTEPLLRIYAESGSRASVNALLEAGRKFAMGDAA